MKGQARAGHRREVLVNPDRRRLALASRRQDSSRLRTPLYSAPPSQRGYTAGRGRRTAPVRPAASGPSRRAPQAVTMTAPAPAPQPTVEMIRGDKRATEVIK